MAHTAWRHVVAGLLLATLAVWPVVNLCCLLTCSATEHQTAAFSHCDTMAEASSPDGSLSPAAPCLPDVVVVSAELTRPHGFSIDITSTTAFVDAPVDARHDTRAFTVTTRIPPRASPLHAVLRI